MANIQSAKKRSRQANSRNILKSSQRASMRTMIRNVEDAISDNDGVALIQVGDAEGINGEYDNKYVWILKMKDGLIHSVREYNSDLLVATRLFKNELNPID